MFEPPNGRWEILPVWRASAKDRRYDFLDRYSIEEFLRRHMFDFGVMVNLRHLLGPDAGRLTDDQVIEQITWKLANKELIISEPQKKDVSPPGDGGGGGADDQVRKAAAPPPANAVKAPPPPKGALRVTVLDDQGKGVAKVEVNGPSVKKTDPSGVAQWDSLAPGSYPVTVSTPLPDPAKQELYLPLPETIPKVAVVPAGGTGAVTFKLKRRPWPTISVDAPKIVIVKHTYHGQPKPGVKPHRIPVKLGLEQEYDGVGELTCDKADRILVFQKQNDAEDKKVSLPLDVKAADLKGKTVWIEAVKPSDSLSDVTLTITLKNGAIPPHPKKNPATEKITLILLKLDIYTWRDENNSAPVLIADGPKLDPGRAVHIQGTDPKRLWAQRAKMALAKAIPHAYTKKLVLTPIVAGSVAAFGADKEKAAAGQAALTGEGLKFPNGTIDAAKGVTLWVEGKTVSGKMSDTGWKVELEELPGIEGDRVTMTVIKAELRVFKSRPAAGGDPGQIGDADKLDVGRYLHKQDPGNNHGRAKLVVRKVKPDGFAGKLFLNDWDITHKPAFHETKTANPRLQLFDAEAPGTGSETAFGTDIPQAAAGAPDDLKTYWVQGKDVSKELIDMQIRVNVRDVDLGCDRGNFTVVQFTKIKATIQPTPPNTPNRYPTAKDKAAQNAVLANAASTAADKSTARAILAGDIQHTFENTHYEEDFSPGKNEPLVLIRNAQPDIALEVTTIPDRPLQLPISWKAVRNTADAGALGGKNDLPTVNGNAADSRKGTLSANQKGSFHIRPFINCNGLDEYSPLEPSIPLNLVLANVAFVADNSAVIPANLSDGVSGTDFFVSNGDFPNSNSWAVATGTPATNPGGVTGAGLTMELQADVTGGGANGQLGLDKVFGGLVNNLEGNGIALTYIDPGPPAKAYTITNIYVEDNTTATGFFRGKKNMYQPGHPGPKVLAWPVLDTGRNPNGLGGELATMGRSGVYDPPLAAQPLGNRYILRCIDSPGRPFPLLHPNHPNAQLTAVHYEQRFRAHFCFWTNITKQRGRTGDTAERVYSVFRVMDWGATGDWTIAWSNATGAWVATPTNTVAHTIAITNPKTFSPIERAQDHGVETRPPSGITTAIAWQTT